MKQFYRKLPVKFAAVVLLLLDFVFGIACLLLVGYMYFGGFYTPGVKNYSDTTLYEDVTYTYMNDAYATYRESLNDNDVLYSELENQVNFGYEIFNPEEPNKILATNHQTPDNAKIIELTIDEVVVRGYVNDTIQLGDLYSLGNQIFNGFFNYRYTALFLVISSIVVGVGLFVFLCCIAGRRAGTDTITLNQMDRIPLDMYAGIVGVLLLIFLFTTVETSYSIGPDSSFGIVSSVMALTLSFGVLLALFLSFATRVKAGNWWKNTVTYRLWKVLKKSFRFGYRIITDLGNNISLLWQVVLGIGGIFAVNIILLIFAANMMVSGIPLILMLLFDLAVLVGVLYVTLCLQRLRIGGQHLAAGEFDYKVDTKYMYYALLEHGQSLNSIGDGMAVAVEEKMKGERLKTELITNVSHDIKTPLTSIINYIDLLRKEELPQQAEEYLEVLERQSKRLKKLTEDLVDASKASTGNLPVDCKPIGLKELVNQSVGEYAQRFEEAFIEQVVILPPEEVMVLADGKYLWRVLDNLLGNICKYGQKGTRAYIQLDTTTQPGRVLISIKNISSHRLNIGAEELQERFVQGDRSRSSEGSGLGLNIARSLVEIQQGTFALTIDGDLFRVDIGFGIL